MALKIADEWWTAPAQADDGRLIMVTGRDGVQKAIDTGKYTSRITVIWDYTDTADGMPDRETSELMEQATDALQRAFSKDPIAIMTGIYTGAGRREWVFYCRNLGIFGKVFNHALEELPTLPIVIEAENDPDWAEYREMRDATYIEPGD